MADNNNDNNNNDSSSNSSSSGGSWWPLILVTVLLLARWLAVGEGTLAVQFRRWYNRQRVQWRKQMGYRDDSAYKTGQAGSGASRANKRQG
mmetsp:Transcript_4858/g.13620  ORF Transcript_4858/g.13620 Transcript_4858/m.13620 type:complete len:91 (+) Transcript_4858:127-399(+)